MATLGHGQTSYLAAIAITALATGVSRLLFPYFHPTNLIMIYLLGVVVVATRYGLGPSVLASILSVASFDFFYTHPYLTFVVSDTQYLLTFAVMLLVAIVISTLTTRAREHAAAVSQAELQIERERLRNALLSSLSHDLRTPLATITGAATSLLEQDRRLNDATRQELTQVVYEEAERLNRLVGNLLDMTRLQSGAIQVRKDWNSMEELVGSALARLDRKLSGRQVNVHIPDEMPLVALDGLLIEQVLINLLENAVKYSPEGSPVDIRVESLADQVAVEVADRGGGIAAGQEELIFDKFYRAPSERSPTGVGLGLTIARGIVKAHGGEIRASNRSGGGALFRFTLPVEGKAPTIEAEPDDFRTGDGSHRQGPQHD
ncbi:MAG TPA: DUF4118 domain-containing protein [Candidatus Obscuribacterales bacterium]